VVVLKKEDTSNTAPGTQITISIPGKNYDLYNFIQIKGYLPRFTLSDYNPRHRYSTSGNVTPQPSTALST